MKPTQICCSAGGLNQIPPWCKISGDIRLVPFYDITECMDRVEAYVKQINENLNKVRISGINLSEKHVFKQLMEFMSETQNLTCLKSLDLNGINLKSEQMVQISQQIALNHSLHNLNIS